MQCSLKKANDDLQCTQTETTTNTGPNDLTNSGEINPANIDPDPQHEENIALQSKLVLSNQF